MCVEEECIETRLDCVNGCDIFIHSFHFISRTLNAKVATTYRLVAHTEKILKANFK